MNRNNHISLWLAFLWSMAMTVINGILLIKDFSEVRLLGVTALVLLTGVLAILVDMTEEESYV